jgi:hypothetical protein
VFIGKNLDHEWLKSCFKACLVGELRFKLICVHNFRYLVLRDLYFGCNNLIFLGELRFKVGDSVQANIGEFVNGKIKKLWDDGNAYRVELEDGEGTNVYAPIDVDTYVRARK